MKTFKLERLIIFFISIVSLSKFFEAGRLISEDMTFQYFPLAVFSGLIFLFTLFILGYWIYIEEKEKNNLRVKFILYEWVYNKNKKRSN